MERVWDAALDLVLERQIGLNWCWAATAKGIVDYYGGPQLPQCRYATHFLNQTESCCDGNEQSPRCDVAYDVDSVLRHFGLYAPPPFRRPVHLVTLRRELERDRPVVALMRFRDGTVHALAITAVDVTEQRIGFSDPWYGPQPDSRAAHVFANDYEGGAGGSTRSSRARRARNPTRRSRSCTTSSARSKGGYRTMRVERALR